MPNTPNKSGIEVLGWELYWTQACARLLSCSNYTWKCLLAGNYCNSSLEKESLPKHIAIWPCFFNEISSDPVKSHHKINRCFSKLGTKLLALTNINLSVQFLFCVSQFGKTIFSIPCPFCLGKETGQIVRIWPYYCLEAWKTNTPVFGFQALVLRSVSHILDLLISSFDVDTLWKYISEQLLSVLRIS